MVFTLFAGTGVSAMYSNEYILAAVLYFVAIVVLIGKGVSSEETSKHPLKNLISSMIVVAGALLFVGSLFLDRYVHVDLEKQKQPQSASQQQEGSPFSFDVEMMIISPGSGDFNGFWQGSGDGQRCTIEPIDDLLFLRVTNTGSGSRTIINYSLETKQNDEWSLMTKKELGAGYLLFTLQGDAIPRVGPVPFPSNGRVNKYPILSWAYGNANVKQSGIVQAQPFDVIAGGQNLTEGQSVRGWSAFQHQGLPDGDIRMKITDELGKTYIVPQTVMRPGPSNDIAPHPIVITALADISTCRQKTDF